MNKHISSTANILHFADDFGQKDVLLTLYQAGRRIYSLQKNAENKAVAENNYIVQRRKIHYINAVSEIKKPIDVVLVSCKNFSLSDLEYLPQKIVVLFDSVNITSENYELESSLDSIKIFRKKE